jgi:mannitol/fructose-specific phosphotransferase system IIA component (Ntr-type)
MHLSELFSARDLVLEFDPADKWQGIRALVEHMVASGRLAADTAEDVLEAVLSRERSMSTGMEHGVAIPHAAVDGLDKVVAALGIVQRDEGLTFDSIDGQPARFVVLLVIPRAQKLVHIRTLADVARVLGNEEIRDALLAATDAGVAHDVLVRGEKLET